MTGERRRVDKDPDELEAEQVRQRIREIDNELGTYEKRQEGGLDQSILSALSPEERTKVTKAYQEQQERLAAVLVDLAIPQRAWFTEDQRRGVAKLNAGLRGLALQPDSEEKMKRTRKWYRDLVASIPNFISLLPAKVEVLIWQAMGAGSSRNKNLASLAQQKKQAGIPLSVDQSILAIEANWRNGGRHEAFKLLQDLESGPHCNDIPVLRLKVYLFADSRRFDECLRTLRTIFELSPRHDPRVVMHLIIGANEGGKRHLSFAMYIWMRQRLGSDMTIKDYDALSLHYLISGRKDLALAVFRDLMFSLMPAGGTSTTASGDREETQGRYEAVLGRLNLLQSGSGTVEEAHSVSIAALTALPLAWQNKYFYASWLKKLIGAGQVDEAEKVMELMFERGVRPDAKHVNGLIGGLFRTGLAADRKKARTIGWMMIQRRLEFMEKLRGIEQGASNPYSSEDEFIDMAFWKTYDLPRATSETFCVLAEDYAVQKEMKRIPQLERLLSPTEIPMNSYFMNQCLVAMEDAPAKDVWDKVSRQLRAVPKDMQTFGILWDREIDHLVRVHRKLAEATDFPTPRRLLASMIAWSRSPHSGAIEHKNLEQPWYETIIRCFCFRRDVAGVLVVIHALRERFSAYPNEETRRLLCVTVASVQNATGDSTPAKRVGRLRKTQVGPRDGAIETSFDRVCAELEALRAQRAAKNGISERHCLNDIDILSEFLKAHMKRVSGTKNAREAILKAKQDMGVEDITTGDDGLTDVDANVKGGEH